MRWSAWAAGSTGSPDDSSIADTLNPYDAGRLGATGIVADARRALAALAEAVQRAGISSPADWQERVRARNRQWQAERAAALDPDTPFDLLALEPAERTDTGAVLTQG